MAQDRGVEIKGLAEDGCIPYAASCKAAQLDVAIQKDVWHPLADVRKVIHDVEREALEKLKVAEQLEKRLRKQWDDAVFVEWMKPYEQFENLLAQINRDHSFALCFQNSVARLWRLEHALRNGHDQFRKAALEARQWLVDWIENDPRLHRLAEQLLTLLEKTVRTSCAAEAINSVLRPYLDRRRECTDLNSRQLFLNLFVLWFNMHKFQRGHRKGKSPYELAGIDLGTDDWLTLLGYPPDLC